MNIAWKGFWGIFFLQILTGCQQSSPLPNILFIMSDDHATNAIGAYNARLSHYAKTPNIDKLAEEGTLFENAFCTNSICVPSRATILTGLYSHRTGVKTLGDTLDPQMDHFVKRLTKAGYTSGLVGKWHLKSMPEGFDYFEVLRNQGLYNNPTLYTRENFDQGGSQYEGHSSEVITQLSLDWLDRHRDRSQPFVLLTHYKSVHEPFYASESMRQQHLDDQFPEPADLLWDESPSNRVVGGWPLETLRDRFLNNSQRYPPPHLSEEINDYDPERTDESSLRRATYQKFIRHYLQGVAGIDAGVGKLIDYLKESGELENTIIIYTSDQGYFLGEHNMFDKRFMYEESARMPLIVRYPKLVKEKERRKEIISNVDFAPTIMDLAKQDIPKEWQGRSFLNLLSGVKIPDWENALYYRYWTTSQPESRPAHLGIRTERFKLIYYYGLQNELKESEKWEFYDLEKDPHEHQNVYPSTSSNLIDSLKLELSKLQEYYGDDFTARM